ncbi:MAG: SipW-dependent-type signal peptide-containing protein [Oscillospiraceae bacterium]|jgi:predicted ribosomally synthesized peptide with SipW-like signal peptide|nr:SipW-dependent-type signal peptide-containing protein [Oscillospiraceae bacterium]
MQIKQKHILIGVLCCVLTLALSFGGTLAYLYATDAAVNSFTIGENRVEIEEPFEPPPKLEPGITFPKAPAVRNTGNLACFVRMRADFSDALAKATCEALDINTAHWEYDATDGYYYYKHLLEPGEITEALFEEVKIKSAATEAELREFDITVYAESRQQRDGHPTNGWKTIWSP